jgi:hypothetical protein
MSYLNFVPGLNSPSGLTKTWNVVSVTTHLGKVSWYAPWRKYCFTPEGNTVFDAMCLHEIAAFLVIETGRHRAGASDGTR